ncbi:hypothetical protein A2774_05445 [Candidatus Roizmanbacteria bacterium RIFCSPHIGHO2_01_FULL_39_12c]|uniref:Glycosyl transferase family 1 domain-containing protein n=1 Tax=Candidatus Roizmanbacteria bacterium RIFCSPHIGHO2_01_FULL_39_12c TaxID=1802031 RepID=A0A1F7GF08_9BACT|nr:MAG: hypothetical protein A2774_05445 [Candidatus Roizmanbacteria bacterium RIFCSPHIGHO2_01_FULL_39_12c]OGK46728.1 MAG: hypothetical protein A2963_00660 [Candidatus Roizmanbacteria bacterium RIFCSPLOWO2_01_FULL_40_13]
MKIAILASNLLPINQDVKKGTELFVYLLVSALAHKSDKIDVTLFASGDSQVPVKLESVGALSSTVDAQITKQHHKIFELALLGKALQQQSGFDLYHANIGNGEIVLPFALFSQKPVIITLHGSLDTVYKDKYFPLFSQLTNAYFVSISDQQRKPLPMLNYLKTIYNGIDVKQFRFDPIGGNNLIWAGRGVPEKGLDIVLTVAEMTKKPARLFAIRKDHTLAWLKQDIEDKIVKLKKSVDLELNYEVKQTELLGYYQRSRLFLSPLRWEEPFGMAMVEAMAAGTPVVAYARGSVPEVIKDGETGFIVNAGENDKRGDWIIKKTGIEGLVEAVERIYALPEEKYKQLRHNCRSHVERNFTLDRMASEYLLLYRRLIQKG